MVSAVNFWELKRNLGLVDPNRGIGINQFLFANDKALVADLENKSCTLVIEFGRVCKEER